MSTKTSVVDVDLFRNRNIVENVFGLDADPNTSPVAPIKQTTSIYRRRFWFLSLCLSLYYSHPKYIRSLNYLHRRHYGTAVEHVSLNP
jgi:hypothetical protein